MLTLAQFELRTELNTANHLIYSSNFAIILADRTDEKEKKIVL